MNKCFYLADLAYKVSQQVFELTGQLPFSGLTPFVKPGGCAASVCSRYWNELISNSLADAVDNARYGENSKKDAGEKFVIHFCAVFKPIYGEKGFTEAHTTVLNNSKWGRDSAFWLSEYWNEN